MALSQLGQYISNARSYWDKQSILIVASSLALLYCTTKIYSKKGAIIGHVLMNLPESVRRTILYKLAPPGSLVQANIYPYSLWMIYRINPDKIDKIQEMLPSGLTIMKHKIYAGDKKEDYYLCYNIYMSQFNDMESLRLEINVIAKNKEKKGCWIVLDAYTDIIRFDSMYPIAAPNCKKKYFEVKTVDGDSNKKHISAGLYINNQEKKHDLFDFKLVVDLKDKPLIADDVWVRANDEMYGGDIDKERVEKYGFICTATFDEKEHDNYLNAEVKCSVNNLFTGIRGEFVSCFVIPNEQNYTLKML